MPLKYTLIEIYSNEDAHCGGMPLSTAVVDYIRGLKIAARCMVTKGVEGVYESGETTSRKIEVLSFNLPIKIEILLPSAETGKVLPAIEDLVCEGIVAVREMDVRFHKAQRRFLPRHLRVADLMTPAPQTVTPKTPVDKVARRLLSSIFTGIPVVDKKKRPLGFITQGDLVSRAGLPIRLGLLGASSTDKKAAVLASLADKTAETIMTAPVVSIRADALVTEAVEVMIKNNVKRLAVIDESGKLTGMLSRLDIFRTVMSKAPDWEKFKAQNIEVNNVHKISAILRRETLTVSPDTPVEDIIKTIDSSDIQRVAVVDTDGGFLGLISDRDLLGAFYDSHPGIWNYFVRHLSFTERGQELETREKIRSSTAAEVMNTDVVTINEETPVEEAITLMAQKALKRLPVLDAQNRFTGMISRDSLLRAIFKEQDKGNIADE